MARTPSDRAARAEASKATVLQLLHGILTNRHGHRAVYSDELAGWVDEEMKGIGTSDIRRFMELEFGIADSKRRAPDEPLEAWEVAELVRDSKWLADGAVGIKNYTARAIKRWCKSIIASKQVWSDLSAKSQGLFGAVVDFAKIDVTIIGADD